MSKLNVGLLGFTGTVGAATLGPLIKAHEESKLNLVILYRESSDLSKLPSDIDLQKRVVYLDEQGTEKTREAVKDLNVIISTVNGEGIYRQLFLLDALKGSDNLKTLIVSDFGANWTKEEQKNKALSPINTKLDVVKKANELGVPVTSVRVGILDLFFYAYKFLGTDVNNNKIETFNDSLNQPLRITSLEYVGNAVTQLIQTPEKIANKYIGLYDIEVTGQQVIDVLTKLHGKPTEVTEYTRERYEEDLKTLPSAIGAEIRKRWGNGKWDNEDNKQVDNLKVDTPGYKLKSFEELTKQYL
ncbi:uncharacterized protein L201_005025 [Kwoniella dendrophila CBS 6074]|uniref:NmrA-like domain-containing protein n=1 Tax=Kwoniella dendrophila CBS 6074 TaxID=1295534 RepID=A0AAX4JXM7_9TREE